MTEKTLEIIKNNKVNIVGEVISGFEYSHKAYGEKYYYFYVSIARKSDTADIIPILVSERIIDITKDLIGKHVEVYGEYRSYNIREAKKRKLKLYVFVNEIDVLDDKDIEIFGENYIFLDGFICKKPIYRVTPFGREITDVLLAVNRPYNHVSDYIPCICWGRNARYVAGLNIGDNIQIIGRVQSRVYNKQISEFESETRTAYEVSIVKLEKI